MDSLDKSMTILGIVFFLTVTIVVLGNSIATSATARACVAAGGDWADGDCTNTAPEAPPVIRLQDIAATLATCLLIVAASLLSSGNAGAGV